MEAPDRDSAVAGQAEAREDREVERARVGAAARVRAEVYGKRGRPRVEAEAEEQARAEEEWEARAAVEGEQAPVAVEDLAVDLERAGQAVAVEDLAVDPDRVDRAAVDRAAVDRAAVDRAAVDQAVEGQVAVDRVEAAPVVEGAEDRAEDLAEVQVGVAEAVGERGKVENQASGRRRQHCCATACWEESRERQEWDPQGWVALEEAEPTR